jgi:hypothetical protein
LATPGLWASFQIGWRMERFLQQLRSWLIRVGSSPLSLLLLPHRPDIDERAEKMAQVEDFDQAFLGSFVSVFER